jgi:hypothetical protein
MIAARLLLVFIPVVATQITLQPKPLIGFSGQNIVISCAKPPNDTSNFFSLELNGLRLTLSNSKLTNATLSGTVVHYTYGPLEKQENGSRFTCDGGGANRDSATITVRYEPEVGGLPSIISARLTMRIIVNFSVDANPPPISKPLLTRVGSTTEIDDSITISDTSITFSSVQCSHNGTYSILISNEVDNVSATFSITVSRSVPMLTFTTTLSLTKEKAPARIAGQIVACPDNRIIITCFVTGRSPIQQEIAAGQDLLWQRSDFVDSSLTSGTVEINCSAANFNTGNSVIFPVTYGKYIVKHVDPF